MGAILKRLFFAAALLLAPSVAYAGADLALIGVGGKGGAGYIGPGDVGPAAYAFYSIYRAYSAAVAAPGTNNAANMQRASDSRTCNLLINTNGLVSSTVSGCSNSGDNGQTVATWCNATTCNTNLVDQIGNTHDLVGGGGSVPIKLNCVSTFTCMNSGGTGYINGSTNSAQSPAAFSASAVIENKGSTGYVFDTNHCGAAVNPAMYWNSNIGVYGSSTLTATAAANQLHAIQGVWGTSAVINVDGTETAGSTGSLSGNSWAGVTIASSNGGGCAGGSTMYLFELALYELSLSSSNRTALCRNQQGSNGYGIGNFPLNC